MAYGASARALNISRGGKEESDLGKTAAAS